MAKKKQAPKKQEKLEQSDLEQENVIILEDEEGNDHEYELIQLFTAGEHNFALLRPVPEYRIFKFSMDKKGQLKGFEDPSDEELNIAFEELEKQAELSGECDCECECCQDMHEPKPAKKAPAKKTAAKKAAKPAAKKPAAKKAAGKKR